MKKTSNITIALKSGVEAQLTIVREQGYEEKAFDLDGIGGTTREYADSASINVTISNVGINNEYATLNGTTLNTWRKAGAKRQPVMAMLTDDGAAAILALTSEILSAEDKAEYEAKAKAAREEEDKYEAHRNMMRKMMGY